MTTPLRIVQGSLPTNGDVVDPSLFLEAWVSGSSIFDMGPGAFKGGTMAFVVSATDPPALQDRQRGTLWFKRGEGRLYLWDQNDLPSGASSADERVTNWISISDRRDIWVKATETTFQGTPLQLCHSGASNTEHEVTTGLVTLGADMTYRVKWAVTHRAGPHNSVPVADALDGKVSEMLFIALESAASGAMLRAVELGFCNVAMMSGESGVAGPLTVGEIGTETQYFKRLDPDILPTTLSGRLFVGFATDSSATSYASAGLRPAWKFALPPIGTARI